jgi:hypothetical protein
LGEMRNVIVAWVPRDALHFEQAIPLRWLGTRNRRLGSPNDLHILFLDGFERLDARYVEALESLGYTLHDCHKNYLAHSRNFQALNQYGDTQKKCFLRWLIIRDVFSGEALVHYDGDVVFNETPEALGQRFQGFTFVLQGCPAVVSISGEGWLQADGRNLHQFAEDVERYSHRASQDRVGWDESILRKWIGSPFRPIMSDQRLIRYLIHKDELPQDDPEQIRERVDLVLFENALYIHEHCPEMLPLWYRRRDGLDYLNGRKVAVWHMQSDFVEYLRQFLLRNGLNRVSRCPNHLEQDSWERSLRRCLEGVPRIRKTRLQIYRRVFEQDDWARLFNDAVWWRKGVFE